MHILAYSTLVNI